MLALAGLVPTAAAAGPDQWDVSQMDIPVAECEAIISVTDIRKSMDEMEALSFKTCRFRPTSKGIFFQFLFIEYLCKTDPLEARTVMEKMRGMGETLFLNFSPAPFAMLLSNAESKMAPLKTEYESNREIFKLLPVADSLMTDKLDKLAAFKRRLSVADSARTVQIRVKIGTRSPIRLKDDEIRSILDFFTAKRSGWRPAPLKR